jgi:DNA-binding transcriptional LysR family regulator
MDWSDLKIFLGAVRAGSYTAAAPLLGVNRTTVGRRVAALEKGVGRPLFLEAPTGPEPTAEGHLVLEAALRIEAEVASLMTVIGTAIPHEASVRVASSAGLAAEVLEAMGGPDSPPVELVSALDPIDAVTRRKADLALALVRSVPRRLTGLSVGPVAQAPYMLRDAQDLPAMAWGAEVENALPRHWTAANLAPDSHSASRFNSWTDLKAAVLAGIGQAWLPCFIADAEPRLVRIGPPDPRFETGLWLLHRTDTPPSAAALRLMDHAAERLGERLARLQAL